MFNRFINSYASESFDRVSLKDEFSDNLVKNVAKNCSSTIVIIHNAGKSTSPHPSVSLDCLYESALAFY